MFNSCDPWIVAHQVPLSMGFPMQEHFYLFLVRNSINIMDLLDYNCNSTGTHDFVPKNHDSGGWSC